MAMLDTRFVKKFMTHLLVFDLNGGTSAAPNPFEAYDEAGASGIGQEKLKRSSGL